MIVQKVFGITQISPGTSLGFRMVQFFLYLGIVGWTILWMLCSFLWPFYYFYSLYRYLKHGEKMGGEEEGYFPWGVRYGVLWNTLIFIGIYVIMPIKLLSDSSKADVEESRRSIKKIENVYVAPYIPYHRENTETSRDENPLSGSVNVNKGGAVKESMPDKDIEYFEDHYDEYLDDPEDIINYPDEIFDFNRD